MGVSDDWSYIHTARTLAQTGHIVYVGWASAIVGWQLFLGAALIKLLGFSFTAPRLGTMLIAVITVFLMQRTLVRFGISEANAVLGTLTYVLSPLFLQLSATMMTDVPGFFSILACIYGCVRAIQALRDRDAILWLCFAVAINSICGTSRQIAWLGVLVIVPCTLWLLRSRRIVLLYGLLATSLGFVFVFSVLHWFNTQPYALPEPVALAPLTPWALKAAAIQYGKCALEIALLLVPVSLPFVAALRRFPKRAILTLVVVFAVLFYAARKANLVSHFLPLNGDWIGSHALFESMILNSAPPVILGPFTMAVLSVIAVIALFSIVAIVFTGRSDEMGDPHPGALKWNQLAVLFGPVTFLYFLLLSRHAVQVIIFDRYLMTPIFVALLCLLLYSQQRLKVRWMLAAYFAIALIAFYGVICTHNTFAVDRARVVLAHEILAAGVPPSHMDLSDEVNGWYELQLSPNINDSRILRPAGTYKVYPRPIRSGCHEQTPFGFFPHLAPRYGISYDPKLCGGLAPFAPVTYSTWPLRHPTTLYVIKYPAPWQSAIESANHVPPSFDQ